MLSVILIWVDALQVSRSTIGRFTNCKYVGKALLLEPQVSKRFPQPVTRPLYPVNSRLQKKIKNKVASLQEKLRIYQKMNFH